MLKNYLFLLKKKYDRYVHDPIIALIVIPIFLFLKLLPYKLASYLSGIIFQFFAPMTKYNSRVIKHLKIAFPQLNDIEINTLAKKHWFVFGQIIGEMPHITKLIKLKRLEAYGLEKIKNGPAILVGAHIGNWEFLLRVADLAGRKAGYVFRPINNWILNKIQIYRNKEANADFYKKGRLAALGMSKKLKNNEIIGLTNDQLLREGINVPFFGVETPTPQAAALMSIKFNVPIYMVRIQRLEGIRFRMTIEDQLKIKLSKVNEENIYNITRAISKRIEEWIVENPEQWLWAHRRWGK